jgi:ABC-type cobalamin/Fe3+-siderophores transport system ATPase subunit
MLEENNASKPSYVVSVKVVGLHRKYDLRIENLQPGINILHGENGSGKTTLLHILANILNSDYGRFAHIEFNYIKIEFDNSGTIELLQIGNQLQQSSVFLRRSDRRRSILIYKSESSDDQSEDDQKHPTHEDNVEILKAGYNPQNYTFRQDYKSFITSLYLPAFRTMIEAWSILENDLKDKSTPVVDNVDRQDLTTHRARTLFGSFLPWIDYLSPAEVEQNLLVSFRQARQDLSPLIQDILSKNFRNVLQVISLSNIKVEVESIDNLLERIKTLAQEIETHPLQRNSDFISEVAEKLDQTIQVSEENQSSKALITGVLRIYRDALQKIVDFQNQKFSSILSYLSEVNKMLRSKKIEISPSSADEIGLASPFLKLVDLDGNYFGDIRYLSSGEKQVFTLLHSITHLNSQEIILIDEPEISIHVDTQSLLMDSMSRLMAGKQIIACTHSPRIAGKQRDRLVEVKLVPTNSDDWISAFPDIQNNSSDIQDDSVDGDDDYQFELVEEEEE